MSRDNGQLTYCSNVNLATEQTKIITDLYITLAIQFKTLLAIKSPQKKLTEIINGSKLPDNTNLLIHKLLANKLLKKKRNHTKKPLRRIENLLKISLGTERGN